MPATTLTGLWAKHHGIAGLATTVRSGRLTAVRLADLCVAEIGRRDPDLHAFISVEPQPPARRHPGPLSGVPIAVKDNIDVRGLPTTLGLPGDGHPPARRDAAAVALLRHAGVTIVGKTNLPEYASSAMGVNPTYGHVANPRDPTRTAGGSSGGSAAAVAAGMAVAALGTDTAGSVLIPAALTGTYGWRPTTGVISSDGVARLSPTLDTVGVIARSIPDLTALALPLLGAHRGAGRPVAPVRLGRLSGWFADVDGEVGDAFEAAMRMWEAGGAYVRDADPPGAANVVRAGRTIYAREAATALAEGLDPHRTYSDAVQARRAARVSDAEWREAQAVAGSWRRRIRARFAQHDALVMPTVALVAPPITAEIESTGRRLVHQTYPVTVAGLPAVTLPLPSAGRLPAGALLVSAPGSDLSLLATAQLLDALLAPHRAALSPGRTAS